MEIANTAHKLAKSITTGIVLLDTDGEIAAELEIDETGRHNGNKHPMELIKDAMSSGNSSISHRDIQLPEPASPFKLPFENTVQFGWMHTKIRAINLLLNPNDLQALVNQAAIALERSLLLVESRRQAVEIKAAYDTLEATYDQTLASLISALDARDQETEGQTACQ